MKTNKLFLTFFLLFGLNFTVLAQTPQITLRGEKIAVENQLYAYLVKEASKEGLSWIKDFSFLSRRDEQLAYAKAITKVMPNGHHYDYYEISFKGYTQTAEMDIETDFGKRLAFDMVLYNMIKNDQLNPESVTKFLERYPPTISKRLNGGLPKNAM